MGNEKEYEKGRNMHREIFAAEENFRKVAYERRLG